MRGTLTPTAVRRACALLLAVMLLLGSAMPALAVTPAEKIRAAREQARVAEKRLDALSTELEERGEEYLAAREALDGTRARIRTTAAELERAEAEVLEARGQLNGRAVSIYRGGGVGVLSVLVGVTDFQDFVTRLDLLQRIGRSDAALVSRVETAEKRVERTRRALENRRAEQVVLVERTREDQARVQAALKAQKSYLASIDGKLKRLIAEERARQERLAKARAEAKRRAAAAAAAAAARAQKAAHASKPDGIPSDAPRDLPPGDGSVVSIARSFIGVTPYVWGGTTPNGFDCSGLTQYCYAKVGVSLPRTSRSQYHAGTQIPADRLDLLRPGDLVFFGQEGNAANIHHVGIYSGNGQFIHAPQTGMKVTESSLIARIESRADYVGAVRP